MGLVFDGVNDYVSYSATGIASGSFTIAIWCYPTGAGSTGDSTYGSLFGGGVSNRLLRGNSGGVSGAVLAQMGGGNLITSTSLCPDNTWNHVAYVYDASGATTQHIYIGGISRASGVPVGTPNFNLAYFIGKFSSGAGAYFYKGNLCELAVWNVALTAGEMSALAGGLSPLLVQGSNLNGYWPLYSSGHLSNYSGSTSGGTLSGATTTSHAPVLPILSLEGEETYIVPAAVAGARKGLTLAGVG